MKGLGLSSRLSCWSWPWISPDLHPGSRVLIIFKIEMQKRHEKCVEKGWKWLEKVGKGWKRLKSLEINTDPSCPPKCCFQLRIHFWLSAIFPFFYPGTSVPSFLAIRRKCFSMIFSAATFSLMAAASCSWVFDNCSFISCAASQKIPTKHPVSLGQRWENHEDSSSIIISHNKSLYQPPLGSTSFSSSISATIFFSFFLGSHHSPATNSHVVRPKRLMELRVVAGRHDAAAEVLQLVVLHLEKPPGGEKTGKTHDDKVG